MTSRPPGIARVVTVLAAAIVVVCFGACASPLPTYPPVSPRESLDTVAANIRKIRTLRARCDLSFTDPSGESVRLDAAVVAAFPDRFRVQAWKFDRTVVDVTCLGGEVFSLPAPDNAPRTGVARSALQTPSRLARSLGPFTAEFWAAAEPVHDLCTPTRIVASAVLGSGDAVLCFVDRRTLTPVRFEPLSPEHDGAGEYFELGSYRVIDGLAWPIRWRFAGPNGEVEIRLSDVELNAAVDDEALTPPRRAVRLP